jgi:hypothetical protein
MLWLLTVQGRGPWQVSPQASASSRCAVLPRCRTAPSPNTPFGAPCVEVMQCTSLVFSLHAGPPVRRAVPPAAQLQLQKGLWQLWGVLFQRGPARGARGAGRGGHVLRGRSSWRRMRGLPGRRRRC